ncbi:MAG: PKD domain-containing protein [Spirochaetales bacterium]|nr:PKD domain-containing protein [Spirochaetales bacterium]
MKHVLKKMKRLRKLLIIVSVRLRKKARRRLSEAYATARRNKIAFSGSLVLAGAAVIGFGMLTSERFPYDYSSLFNSEEFLSRKEKTNGDTSYIEMGSGLLAFNRSDDIEYVIKDGDTLPEIAYLYNVEVVELMLYNKLKNLEDIKPGRQLVIPSAGNMIAFMAKVDRAFLSDVIDSQKPTGRTKNLLPKSVSISCNKRSDGQSITAIFAVDNDIKEKGVYFEWDLGDGKKSFRKTFSYTYNAPGTYIVNLAVKDIYGNRVRSRPIYLDIPYATYVRSTGQTFITVNNVGDVFSVDGEVFSVYDALGRVKNPNAPIQFINRTSDKSGARYYYQTHVSGYFSLLAHSKSGTKKIYLFVSPFDSVQNDRFDIDWYRTQYNTGLSNCGPAIASMGIGWSKGEYVSVTAIRNMMGWSGDGSTSFFDIKGVLDRYQVANNLKQITDKEEIFDLIDNGNILGVLYNCGRISRTHDEPQFNLVGKYYQDAVGHYSIIKGYTKDRKYFIIYDPIPSDWINNGLRYGDAISMIGRNRYYPSAELFQAMYSGMVLVIHR